MAIERAQTTNPRITFFEAKQVDAPALEAALRDAVKGEVRFDAGSKALYATDASNYRQVPIGVVIPRDADDVIETVRLCREHGAPIVSRGGGTSLCGQTCNFAVVMDFSKYMNRVIDVDVEKKTARVLPGLVLDHLNHAATPHGLIFGPDPATHSRCTLGGMIGNDSCGMHAQYAGRTSENVESLDVLLYDGTRMTLKNRYEDAEIQELIGEGGRQGEVFQQLLAFREKWGDRVRERFPKLARLVSGYGLQYLLPENGFNLAAAVVGSEATLVTVLDANLKLLHNAPFRTLLILGYPSVYEAADHVTEVVKHRPLALEGMDDLLVGYMAEKHGKGAEEIEALPPGKGWLMIEFGGETLEESDARAKALMDELKDKPDAPSMHLFDKKPEEHELWEMREGGLGATAFVPGQKDTWEGWEDSAVPPEQLGTYLRQLRDLFSKYGYKPCLYGHFGQGCVHTRVEWDPTTKEGIDKWRAFLDEAARLVTELGGSLSGEHGDGQSKAELLPIMFGPELVDAFREFKAIWDPEAKMNPGKVVDPYPITSNLRLGADYAPPELKTHFQFPDDHGSFAHAAMRCVGVGACRRSDPAGGVMCPSFQVTRDEKDSTRGRGHSLFEMVKGDVLTKGWKDEAVKDALDLCLACKGCKSDCPVNVDMATYKAEFLSHYYEGRLRPITAYTMGLIMYWAKAAALAPRVVNFVTHAPGLAGLVKKAGGIDARREVPSFAEETFQAWWARRAPRNVNGKRVILWADTFNDNFHPKVAKAAVEVLEAAGYRVIVPQGLCCGRPLYDYGYLDLAKRFLRESITAMAPYVREGVPIVGLEPSCTAVFRDEIGNLFPNDKDAERLKSHTFVLSEFLAKIATDFQLPKLKRKAIVQVHCHHKSVMKDEAELKVLDALGLDYEVLDSGCCGMAGAFGFEAGEHYDVAMAAGERKLLPAVRAADDDTIVIANGFSCHEQIAQGAGREALHLAEVVQLALREAGYAPTPEPKPAFPRAAVAVGVLALGAAALAVGVTRRGARRA